MRKKDVKKVARIWGIVHNKPMRVHIERELAKKQAEATKLEGELAVVRGVMEALSELLKKLPKDGSSEPSTGSRHLRPGSDVYRSREAILAAGKPLHISELLSAIGKEVTKKNRTSLTSSLGVYARKREHFTKEGPNRFGVVGMQKTPTLVPESLSVAS